MRQIRKVTLSLITLAYFLSACETTSSDSSPEGAIESTPLFSAMDPQSTGLDFVNQVDEGDEFNVLTYRNFYNGGGVAIGDVNNDGLPDIFFTANMYQNKLYLNRGDWQFEEVTDQARIGGEKGWSTGASMADVNGDGWLDIYVCHSGDIQGDNKQNELFINKGIQAESGQVPTFSEEASAYNLADEG
ncbi:MAG: VCBS repeat-containing protein, partial [Saprospiraceae bacterium]|nr:VCBS repeat-containing protein [Saprospiraceae bacterium]